MKITRLEDALNKRVKCTDGEVRTVTDLTNMWVWFRYWDSRVITRKLRRTQEQLFIGGEVVKSQAE